MRYLTPDDVLNLLEVARKRSPRDHFMLLLAYRHGLRASELVNIKLTDIKNGFLTVARVKGSLKTVQPLMDHENELLDEMKAYKACLKHRAGSLCDYLFVSRLDDGMHRQYFWEMFQDIAETAGLPAELRHPHQLKHAICTQLVKADMPIAFVRELVGHADIKNTMIYTHLTAEEVADKTQNYMRRIF